jgi:hypothetical protein
MPPPPPIAPRPNIGGATGGRALDFFLASGLGGAARLAVFLGGFLAAIIHFFFFALSIPVIFPAFLEA